MTPIKNVVVAGAGGNLGPFILSALHSAHFTVSALIRPDSRSTYPSYVTTISTDYSPSSLLAAFAGQDAVISAIGVFGVLEQRKLIDAAEQAGVQRFVPSEFGWAKDRPILPELVARLKPKEEVFGYLVEACRASRTMSWSAVATGPFLDWSLKVVPTLGFVVANHTARIYDSGDEMLTCSTGADIGTAAANMLIHAEETADRFLKIRSVQFSQNQLLGAVEKVTEMKWTVTRVSTKDVLEDRKKKMQEKNFQGAFMDTLVLQLFEDGARRGVVVPDENDNDMLGVKEESVEEVVRKLLS